jgi:ABC-type antimicrobial peptide transport system permease subunit
MIFKNLFRRKSRSLLTLAGIAIGVAAMIALGALGAGLASGYQAIAGGSQADLIMTQAESYDLSLSSVDEHIGDQLLVMPEVSEAAGMMMGNVSAEEGAKYFFIFGHDPDRFAVEHFRIIEGQTLNARGVRGRPILLGKNAVEGLEVGVGDTVNLTGGTFRVVGIYETGDAFEDGAAVMTLKDAQTILQKPRLVNAFYLKLKDTRLADRLIERAARLYPENELDTPVEFGDKQQAVEIMEGMASAVAGLAIIVGGVTMTNTILMSVYERTREIGVLRAVGWRRRRVLTLILGESILLALVGGLIGTIIGVALVYSIRNVPLYGYTRGQFSSGLFLQAFVVAVVLGIVGGLYPAWRASKLQPLEAMRYDGGGHSRASSRFNLNFGGMTLKSVFRRKTRTALTLVAIGIGVGAIVGLGAVIDGVITQLDTIFSESNAHIMALEADVSDMGYSAIPESVGARIAAHPEVAHVSGTVVGFNMEYEESPIFIIWGYHPQEKSIARFKIIDGEPLRANRQVVLGKPAAEALGKKVGDTFRVGESAFRVVGIFETGTGYEETGGLFTRRDTQVIAGKPSQVNWYSIELKDPAKADEMMAYFDRKFPEIDVSLTSEFAESLPDMESSRAMLSGIAVLMALVGAFGMTNTILMSVLERTRELGVLRAVGWSRRRILTMIIKESLLLGILGGLTGILIGFLLARGIAAIPSIGEMVGQGSFPPALLAQAMAIAVILGAVGGIYPAWRATKMQPVEALRYE